MSSAGLGTVLVRTDKDRGGKDGGGAQEDEWNRYYQLEFYQNFHIRLLSDLTVSQICKILSSFQDLKKK